MPGTSVTTAVRSGASFPQTAPGAALLVPFVAERGPTNMAADLQGMTSYADIYGGRVTYGAGYDCLRCFFEEGGGHAVGIRVAGPAASTGSLVLVDRAGAPLNTVRINAADPGAWSTGLTVQVENGAQVNTVRLTVRYSGTGGPGVEVYDNLANPAAIVDALASSAYVRATNLASATAAPNNNPAVIAATALSAGTDDHASVTSAQYLAALQLLNPGLAAVTAGGPAALGTVPDTGAVAIPGQTSAAIGAGLMLYARNTRRLALMAAAQGATHNAAIAEAQGLRANTGAEQAGLFHPWLTMPDDAGGVRTVDPVGYVAAVRARAHEQQGPWRAPAGDLAAARFVVGTLLAVTPDDSNTLDAGEVNAIRVMGNRPRLYGWRSLSLNEADYRLLTVRDIFDLVEVQTLEVLEHFVFDTIDSGGREFARLAAECTPIVSNIAQAGGFYALRDAKNNLVDPGWRVDTGPNVNTPATIAADRLRVAIGGRPSPTAEFVDAIVTKAGIGATL